MTELDLYLKLNNLVFSYEHLGTSDLQYAKLYGKAPHVAPYAWLHGVFKPLSDNEIKELKIRLNRLPEFLQEFYKYANGFSIYSNELSIYGLRRSVSRDIDSVWQPFDIIDLNYYDRPKDSVSHMFFFGGYYEDGSLLYYNELEDTICRCSAGSTKPINIWNSFKIFLMNELTRLKSIHDSKGILISSVNSSLP